VGQQRTMAGKPQGGNKMLDLPDGEDYEEELL
jgi:hypothetical protein